MAKKAKVNVLVETLRSIPYLSDKEALSCLGLDFSDIPLDEALLADLHQFEKSAAQLLLAVDVIKVNRRFG